MTIDKTIVGNKVGGDPENEEDNFYFCDICNQYIDRKLLWQVMHHQYIGHKPHELDS